jgi:hypothetical protein
MMTTIYDAPTLSLAATHITGALAAQRRRDEPPEQPTISTALHDLFMATMAFYSARRDLSMSLALVQTLYLAFPALRTGRGEFLLINLLVEIVERDTAAPDPGVHLALVRACTAINHVSIS